jgi:hypothetical protein
MAEHDEAGRPYRPDTSPTDRIATAHPETIARDDDAALLTLEKRFNDLAAELAAVQPADRESGASPASRSFDGPPVREEAGREALTSQVEAILARLYPVERAIVQTPAHTIAGLAVKAHHAAYVVSQYWDAPVDRIDWHARTLRLLIEAVCEFARAPLSFPNEKSDQ